MRANFSQTCILYTSTGGEYKGIRFWVGASNCWVIFVNFRAKIDIWPLLPKNSYFHPKIDTKITQKLLVPAQNRTFYSLLL